MDPIQEKLTDIALAADWDSDHDESFDAAIGDIQDEAISEFTYERLQSYYLQNSDLRERPAERMESAHRLLEHDASAALVFAISAAEICIKNLILRPLVYGFVHQPYAANLVADLAVSQTGWDRSKKLLAEILREKVRIDLDAASISLAGTTKPLWNEFNASVKLRNKVLHQGQDATRQEAEGAVAISCYLIDDLFPKLLKEIGLTIADGHIMRRRMTG